MSQKLTVTGSVTNPVSLNELKAWLRINQNVTIEDPIFQLILDKALEDIENMTGRILTSRTFELYTDELDVTNYYPTIEINTSPVTVISDVLSSVEGTYTSLSGYYKTEITDQYTSVYFTSTIQYDDDVALPFKLTFTAGYSTTPKVLKMAVLQCAAFLYSNRGDFSRKTVYPIEIEAAIDNYRIISVM